MKIIVRTLEKDIIIKYWLINNVVPLSPCTVVIKCIVEDREEYSHNGAKISKAMAKDTIEIYSALSTQELKLSTNLHVSREILLLHFSKNRVRDRSEALAIRYLEENVDKRYNREYYPYVPLL